MRVQRNQLICCKTQLISHHLPLHYLSLQNPYLQISTSLSIPNNTCHSFHSFILTFFITKPTFPLRRCTLSTATTTTTVPPHSEDSNFVSKFPPNNRIHATTIIGFLASVKTTLLNYILSTDHGKHIVVIENELVNIKAQKTAISRSLKYLDKRFTNLEVSDSSKSQG